jgi:hypothetical protein
MTGGKARRATTLVLMYRWVRDVRRLERLIHASWLRDPWSKILQERRRMRLQHRIAQETVPELADRYQGVMYQILSRIGIPREQLPGAFSEVWQLAQTSVRTTLNPRRVPQALWTARSAAIRPSAAASQRGAAERLKPKLMLRALVDEIPPCDERGVLRSLAYDFGLEPPQRSREALRALSDALGLLHAQVLHRSSELEVLSDGALSPARVAAFSAPFEQYRDWLFRD